MEPWRRAAVEIEISRSETKTRPEQAVARGHEPYGWRRPILGRDRLRREGPGDLLLRIRFQFRTFAFISEMSVRARAGTIIVSSAFLPRAVGLFFGSGLDLSASG
jgi:hypothetical protein